MKPAAITFLVIFLLLTIVITSVVGLVVNEAVRDINGNPVKPNERYFIKSARQKNFWVDRYRRLDNACPQVAILTSSPLPVIFLLQSGADYLPLSTDLSIMFTERIDRCSESGIWRVDTRSPYPYPDITATGSVLTPDSTFKIEKSKDVYKLVYGSESSNIGVYTDLASYLDHLVINTTPLEVIFEPAHDAGHKTLSFLNNMVPYI